MLRLLTQQLGLWAVGQALPPKPALSQYLRHAGGFIAGSVILGLLVGGGLLLGLYGLYVVLVIQGLSSLWAAGVVGIFTLMLVAIVAIWTLRQADRVTSVKEGITPNHDLGDPLQNLADAMMPLVDAFVDGIKTNHTTKTTTAQPHTKNTASPVYSAHFPEDPSAPSSNNSHEGHTKMNHTPSTTSH